MTLIEKLRAAQADALRYQAIADAYGTAEEIPTEE